MMSKEDVISLIVEGDHSTAVKFGIVRKQTGEHPSDRVPQSSVEIVQNDFGLMFGGLADALDFFAELQRIDFVVGGGAFGQVTNQKIICKME